MSINDNNKGNVQSFQIYQKLRKQSKSIIREIKDQRNHTKVLSSRENQQSSSQSQQNHLNTKTNKNIFNKINFNESINKQNLPSNNNDQLEKKNKGQNKLTSSVIKDKAQNKVIDNRYVKKKSIKSNQQKQKQMQRALSPNRHKNHNHSPMKTVPYSEIEIILSNIQQIKSKAHQQISQWSRKNNQLVCENQKLKQQIQRVNMLQKSIAQQRIQMQKHKNELNDIMKQKQKQNQLKQRVWAEEKQQYIQEMLNVKETMRLAQEEADQMKEYNKQITSQKQEILQRYESLVDLLTTGNKERLAELVYQLNENYRDQAVLDILLQSQRQNASSEQQYHQLQTKISTLTLQLQNQKQQRQKAQHLVSKLIQQNKQLIQTIAKKQQTFQKQKQQLMRQIEQSNNSREQLMVNFKNQLNRASSQRQLQVQEKLSRINSLQRQIISLKNDVNRLQRNVQQNQQTIEQLKSALKSTIEEMTLAIQQKQTHIANIQHQHKQQMESFKVHYRYFDVVDQQCEELNDLARIVSRLQSIEKIKLENQTNIQKIQFLSKMLDC